MFIYKQVFDPQVIRDKIEAGFFKDIPGAVSTDLLSNKELIANLKELVVRDIPVIVVHGESGTGKSSLRKYQIRPFLGLNSIVCSTKKEAVNTIIYVYLI